MRHDLSVPLFGLHHVENVALVFAAACTYGADPETVTLALKFAPQITHRLEVKPGPNDSVLVDDAYNSNPKGFTSALETLDLLVREGGRRIVVTPGMVELGADHDEEHTRLGKIAAEHADVVLAIAPERMKTFVSAYQEAAGEREELHTFPGFAEADIWLQENTKSGRRRPAGKRSARPLRAETADLKVGHRGFGLPGNNLGSKFVCRQTNLVYLESDLASVPTDNSIVAGIDVGGTFTDLLLVGPDDVRVLKTPTTLESSVWRSQGIGQQKPTSRLSMPSSTGRRRRPTRCLSVSCPKRA